MVPVPHAGGNIFHAQIGSYINRKRKLISIRNVIPNIRLVLVCAGYKTRRLHKQRKAALRSPHYYIYKRTPLYVENGIIIYGEVHRDTRIPRHERTPVADFVLKQTAFGN